MYLVADEYGVREPFDPFAPDWYEYRSQSDAQLIATWEGIVRTPGTQACDNRAPGTCCDYCNMHEIRDELMRRGLISLVSLEYLEG